MYSLFPRFSAEGKHAFCSGPLHVANAKPLLCRGHMAGAYHGGEGSAALTVLIHSTCFTRESHPDGRGQADSRANSPPKRLVSATALTLARRRNTHVTKREMCMHASTHWLCEARFPHAYNTAAAYIQTAWHRGTPTLAAAHIKRPTND